MQQKKTKIIKRFLCSQCGPVLIDHRLVPVHRPGVGDHCCKAFAKLYNFTFCKEQQRNRGRKSDKKRERECTREREAC